MIKFRFIDDSLKTLGEMLASPFDKSQIVEIEYTQDAEQKEAEGYKTGLQLEKEVEVLKVGGGSKGKLPINSPTTKEFYGNDPAINEALENLYKATRSLTGLIKTKWGHTAKCYIRKAVEDEKSDTTEESTE